MQNSINHLRKNIIIIFSCSILLFLSDQVHGGNNQLGTSIQGINIEASTGDKTAPKLNKPMEFNHLGDRVLESSLNDKSVQYAKVTPNGINLKPFQTSDRVISAEELTHTIEGEWDNVRANIGYTFQHPINGTQLQSLITLKTVKNEDNQYVVPGWDFNVFWMDFNDGKPIPLTAMELGFYDPPEDQPILATQGTLWCMPYAYIQQPGKDYSDYIYKAAPCYVSIVTDDDNNVIDYCIDVYTDDGEYQYSKFLVEGDRILCLAPGLIANQPGTVNLNSFDLLWEDNNLPSQKSGREVTQAPQFYYSHLTPGVDFEIPEHFQTIDFSSVELKVILDAYKKTEEGYEWGLSSIKPLGISWDTNASMVENSFDYK